MRRILRKTYGKALAPPPPGHGDFWATVHVKFTVPMPDQDDPAATPVQGYCRSFGVRALPTRVHLVVTEAVKDGIVDWEKTEWELVDPTTLEKAIKSRIVGVEGEGIWYESGRVLYADPDLEPQPS